MRPCACVCFRVHVCVHVCMCAFMCACFLHVFVHFIVESQAMTNKMLCSALFRDGDGGKQHRR